MIAATVSCLRIFFPDQCGVGGELGGDEGADGADEGDVRFLRAVARAGKDRVEAPAAIDGFVGRQGALLGLPARRGFRDIVGVRIQ